MFDTWGAFGFGFVGNLNLGGPAPIGAQKAALSDKVLPYMQEIALSEQVCIIAQHLSSFTSTAVF